MKNIYIGICVGIIAITSIAHAEPSDPTLYFKNNSKHTIRLTLLDTARQRIQLGYYAAQFIIDPDESLTNNQFSIEQIGGMLIEYCKEEKKIVFVQVVILTVSRFNKKQNLKAVIYMTLMR